MKKLSSHHTKEQEIYVEQIREKQAKLVQEIENFNEEVSNMWQHTVLPALEKLNNVLMDADSFREQVHSEMEEYLEERSEKWQASEEGEKYLAWMDHWEVPVDEVELEEPLPVDAPDMMDFDYEVYPDEP